MADMVFSLGQQALARAMPMHVCLTPGGRITSTGPTLARIAPEPLVGRPLFDAFDLRRPGGITDLATLGARAGERLHLALRCVPETGLRGLALPLVGGGMLLNLSFGIDLPEAVRQHRLDDGDFAPTDLAIELLCLTEVMALVMGEMHDLNRRLQGAKSQAEAEAQTDTLTGLRNRRAMDARLAELIESGQPFGLMHVDLDYFKQINDSFGHAAGDHVLQEVARLLTSATRQNDTVARIGGDEFVILLPGLVDPGRLERVARRIIDNLDRPIPFAGQPCHVSASIGITASTHYPRPGADTMLSDADHALYASKHAGRRRVTLHDPGGDWATGEKARI